MITHTIQKITKSDKLYGPVHGIGTDINRTICGMEFDSNWYILKRYVERWFVHASFPQTILPQTRRVERWFVEKRYVKTVRGKAVRGKMVLFFSLVNILFQFTTTSPPQKSSVDVSVTFWRSGKSWQMTRSWSKHCTEEQHEELVKALKVIEFVFNQ